MTIRRPLTWWLAVSGVALLLLFIPNGIMHQYLGSLTYGRDVLVASHLALCLFCLHRTGHLFAVQRRLLPFAVLILFFTPLVTNSSSLKDALVVTKWVFQWADVTLTGYLMFLLGRTSRIIIALGVLCVGLFSMDSCIGLYELKTNSFFFPVAKDEETDMGVRLARSKQLVNTVRVQGMQRDVFSFANFMGVGFAACLATIAVQRRLWLRAMAAGLGLFFLYVGYYSGGRSALFGMALCLLLFGLAMLSLSAFTKHSRKVLSATVLAGMIICYIGLAPILTSVVSAIGSDSRVFNMASTFERDAVWTERLDAMAQQPFSYLIGMSLTGWATGASPMVLFADNQPLWLLYHTGAIGLLMMLRFFYRWAAPVTRAEHPAAYVALVFSMALVLGEGIARDTLFMFSAIPMFLFGGYFVAADAYAAAALPDGDFASGESLDLELSHS